MGASVNNTSECPLGARTGCAGFVELEILHGLTGGKTCFDEDVETPFFACPPTSLQYPAIQDAGYVVGVGTPVEAHGSAAIVGVDVDGALDRFQFAGTSAASYSGLSKPLGLVAVRWGARDLCCLFTPR